MSLVLKGNLILRNRPRGRRSEGDRHEALHEGRNVRGHAATLLIKGYNEKDASAPTNPLC